MWTVQVNHCLLCAQLELPEVMRTTGGLQLGNKVPVQPVPVAPVDHEVPAEGAGRGAGGQDHRVLGVAAPLQEQLPREAALHVWHRGKDYLGRGRWLVGKKGKV